VRLEQRDGLNGEEPMVASQRALVIVGHARRQTHSGVALTRARDLGSPARTCVYARWTRASAIATDPRGESIGDNIVEGCGASTNEDFAKFLDSSIKSANETEGHLLKAKDLGLISHRDWQTHSNETLEVRKMTFGYRKKVLRSDTGDHH